MEGIVVVCNSSKDIEALTRALRRQSLAGIIQHAADRANAMSRSDVAQVQLASLLNRDTPPPPPVATPLEDVVMQINENSKRLNEHRDTLDVHGETLHDLVKHEQEELEAEQRNGGPVRPLRIRPELFAHYGLDAPPAVPLPVPDASTRPPIAIAVPAATESNR